MVESEGKYTQNNLQSMSRSRLLHIHALLLSYYLPSIWLNIGVEIAVAITIHIEICCKCCARSLLVCVEDSLPPPQLPPADPFLNLRPSKSDCPSAMLLTLL